MARRVSSEVKTSPPALSPTGRENQLKSIALDLAEQKIRDGTASSQLLTLILKMDSEKEQLERELLEKEAKLKEAKISAIRESQKDGEALRNALSMFKRYSGTGEDDDEYL